MKKQIPTFSAKKLNINFIVYFMNTSHMRSFTENLIYFATKELFIITKINENRSLNTSNLVRRESNAYINLTMNTETNYILQVHICSRNHRFLKCRTSQLFELLFSIPSLSNLKIEEDIHATPIIEKNCSTFPYFVCLFI